MDWQLRPVALGRAGGDEGVDQADDRALIAFGQGSHALKSFPEPPFFRIFLFGFGLRRLQSEQLVGGYAQQHREGDDDISGRRASLVFVVGDGALGGAQGLGYVELGEAASFPKDRKDWLPLCKDSPVGPPPAAADNGPYVDFDVCPTTSSPFYIRTASQDTTS